MKILHYTLLAATVLCAGTLALMHAVHGQPSGRLAALPERIAPDADVPLDGDGRAAGTVTVAVQKVVSSCHCMEPDDLEGNLVLPPGGRLALGFRIEPPDAGEQRQVLSVVFADGAGTVQVPVSIQGTRKFPLLVHVSPQTLRFDLRGGRDVGQDRPWEIETVEAVGSEPWIAGAGVRHDGVGVRLDRVETTRVYNPAALRRTCRLTTTWHDAPATGAVVAQTVLETATGPVNGPQVHAACGQQANVLFPQTVFPDGPSDTAVVAVAPPDGMPELDSATRPAWLTVRPDAAGRTFRLAVAAIGVPAAAGSAELASRDGAGHRHPLTVRW